MFTSFMKCSCFFKCESQWFCRVVFKASLINTTIAPATVVWCHCMLAGIYLFNLFFFFSVFASSIHLQDMKMIHWISVPVISQCFCSLFSPHAMVGGLLPPISGYRRQLTAPGGEWSLFTWPKPNVPPFSFITDLFIGWIHDELWIPSRSKTLNIWVIKTSVGWVI